MDSHILLVAGGSPRNEVSVGEERMMYSLLDTTLFSRKEVKLPTIRTLPHLSSGFSEENNTPKATVSDN